MIEFGYKTRWTYDPSIGFILEVWDNGQHIYAPGVLSDMDGNIYKKENYKYTKVGASDELDI